MSPEVNHTEEGEVDVDAVEEIAVDTGSADILCDRVQGHLSTGLDAVAVGTAVGLLIRQSRPVAEGLWAVGGVLRSDHHRDRVVQCKSNQGEEDCCEQHGLW